MSQLSFNLDSIGLYSCMSNIILYCNIDVLVQTLIELIAVVKHLRGEVDRQSGDIKWIRHKLEQCDICNRPEPINVIDCNTYPCFHGIFHYLYSKYIQYDIIVNLLFSSRCSLQKHCRWSDLRSMSPWLHR